MPLLVAAAAAIWAVAHGLLIVPRLPQPDDSRLPGEQPAPRYGDLVTSRNLLWLFAGSFAAGQITWLIDRGFWPLWFIYAGSVATLAGIDALTTYLPLGLNYLCLAELLIAASISTIWLGWIMLVRATAGALVAGALFWIVWRVSSTFGFGDVRLALLVGFVAAAHSWTTFFVALVSGTALGAVWGIVTAIRAGRTDAVFPYGPALWLGPFAAILVSALAE